MRWSRWVSALVLAAATALGACGAMLEIEPGVAGPDEGGADADAHPDDAGRADEASKPAVVEIAAGSFHSCALLDDGSVWCWGANTYGQLGAGPNTTCTGGTPVGAYPCRTAPTRVAGLANMAHLAKPLGGDYSCALDAAGALYCWGRNDIGQLGHAPVEPPCSGAGPALPCNPVPTQVPGLGPVARASAGAATACAVTRDAGAVYCWGDNALDQAGRDAGSLGPGAPTPVIGSEMASGVSSVASTLDISTCATKGSSTWCWGGNYRSGNLGHLPSEDPPPTCDDPLLDKTGFPCTPTPQKILVGAGVPVDTVGSVAGGGAVGCVRRLDGSLWCWGNNEVGGLGNGGWDESAHIYAAPVMAVDAVASVSVGSNAVCVASEAGVQCWGNNAYGTVGTGSFASIFDAGPDGATDGGTGCVGGTPCVARPQRVTIGDPPAFTEVAVGSAHAVALRADGTIWSWGYNTYGQLAHAPSSAGDVACAGSPSEWCNPTATQVAGLP